MDVRECYPSPCNGEDYGRLEGQGAMPVQKKDSPRVQIDTSPPFGSVKEAVTHFEGTGFCPPFHPLGFRPDFDVGEVDLKVVEEQTLELEKSLIMKELETLDVLEELGTTKRIVEELKWQLQKEALKCMASVPEPEEQTIRSSPGVDFCGHAQNQMQSQGSILMELNQARSNLGKTISELGMIQTSVESLNKRIKREKEILEKTRLRRTSKSSDARASPLKLKPQPDQDTATMLTRIDTAEMKLVAARKMEEAARAAEAVAMAEIRAFSRNEAASFNIYQREPPDHSIPFYQRPFPMRTPQWNVEEALTQNNKGGKRNGLRSEILQKLEDATEEVKLSQQALEEALSRVEIANRKQVAASEALRRWTPKRGNNYKNPYLANTIFPLDRQVQSPATDIVRTNLSDDEPKPVLRTTVSMRDVLGRKLILPEEYMARRQTEGRRVALSQMLNELREDLSCTVKSDKGHDHRKQFLSQRKKFGFMHISLPLTKQSKKNEHSSDLRCRRPRFSSVHLLIIFHGVLMLAILASSKGDFTPSVEEESWGFGSWFQPGTVREGMMSNEEHGRTQAWSPGVVLLNFLPGGMFPPSGPSKRSNSLND